MSPSQGQPHDPGALQKPGVCWRWGTRKVSLQESILRPIEVDLMPALPLQVRGQMSLYMLTLRCKKIIRHSPHPQPKHTLARVKWLGRHDHISVQEALEYNLTSQFESNSACRVQTVASSSQSAGKVKEFFLKNQSTMPP